MGKNCHRPKDKVWTSLLGITISGKVLSSFLGDSRQKEKNRISSRCNFTKSVTLYLYLCSCQVWQMESRILTTFRFLVASCNFFFLIYCFAEMRWTISGDILPLMVFSAVYNIPCSSQHLSIRLSTFIRLYKCWWIVSGCENYIGHFLSGFCVVLQKTPFISNTRKKSFSM